MAAVLSPRIDATPDVAPWNADAPGNAGAPWNDHAGRSSRPHLRLVEGGRSSRSGAAAELRRVVLRLTIGLALAALVSLAAFGAVQFLGADAAASGPASTAEPVHPVGVGASTSPAPAVVVVGPGDTLWGIARSLRPTGDIRPVVAELAARAGGAELVVGQRLDVSGLGG